MSKGNDTTKNVERTGTVEAANKRIKKSHLSQDLGGQHAFNQVGASKRMKRGLLWLLNIVLPITIMFAPANAQFLPDADNTCVVPSPLFASWFETKPPSKNGVVKPANGVTFPDPKAGDNCLFYRWSEQMFLWLTSPSTPAYGGGPRRIFESPAFFDVSPPSADGNRTFIRHVNGTNPRVNVMQAQLGPHGLPMVLARKSGTMMEFEPARITSSGKQLIQGKLGNWIEIERATLGKDQKPVFFDSTGKAIQPLLAPQGTTSTRRKIGGAITLKRFLVGITPIFVDPSGNVVDVEQGQSFTNGVLQAQNGSLVYYRISTNDIFAYFLTGVKNKELTLTVNGNQTTPTSFPTTADELQAIIDFGMHHGKTFPDPEALAVEIKSSWVKAAGLSNLSSYITTTATVPKYDMTQPDRWTGTGETETVQLALVGLHIAGSVNGHPELIWATFEHFANAPRGTYQYRSKSLLKTEDPKPVPPLPATGWLFNAGVINALDLNSKNMRLDSPNIEILHPGFSNTMLWKAWGAASDLKPNPLVKDTADSNTQVISINNFVNALMPKDDVRKNYIMTGATWTIGGRGPNDPPTNQVGTSLMSNSTMETYVQGSDTKKNGDNCFTCHRTAVTPDPNAPAGFGVSRIYDGLRQLFP
jgi:hypothetical protein